MKKLSILLVALMFPMAADAAGLPQSYLPKDFKLSLESTLPVVDTPVVTTQEPSAAVAVQPRSAVAPRAAEPATVYCPNGMVQVAPNSFRCR